MDYNRIGGVSFALWGVIHVVVALVGVAIYLTGGTEGMLAFVDLDAAANAQSARMADLVVEFYQALFLIGLTVTAVGLTLNREGSRLGLWLNAILVTNIEVAFVWFEVLPGHRPVPIAVVTVGLLVVGVVCCWLGLESPGVGDRGRETTASDSAR